MGQTNLIRTHFAARETITVPKNDDRQEVARTCFFEVGDTVDIIDEDIYGNVVSVIANNLTILSIAPDNFVVLDQVVDSSAATGTPRIRVQSIDDGQQAIERLYCRQFRGQILLDVRQAITAQELNAPIVGQTKFDVDDASFWRAGDTIDILADEGIIQTGVTIVSVTPNADQVNNSATIVVGGVIDTSTFTNPFILSTDLTYEDAIRRNQERIDGIDLPVENEYKGVGDHRMVAWETVNLFVEGSTKVFIDGRRQRLGTCGTRASHVEGAGDSQLTFTSMILGLDGNNTSVEVVNGVGINVLITGNYNSGFSIQVTNDSGTATAAQIATALNAHPEAKRLIQVQWGGTGAGAVAAFGPVSLAGGLDDGTGDYCEIAQVYENFISGTGFKWIAFHIRPDERNRLNQPLEDDEELTMDYRKAAENVDR